MNTENLMDVLQSLDRKVEEMLQTIRQLRTERDQLRGERDQLKTRLDETVRAAETTREQWQESQRQQDELTHLVNSVGSDRSQLRERIQLILSKIENLES